MMSETQLLIGGMSYVTFLCSTTCHEAAHAWAALKLGDDTAHRGGQVSLDPTPHIKREPLGMVVAPLLSFFIGGGMMFGWASAPYDPNWALRWPKRCALMAMAGPSANFTLVIMAALLMKVGIMAGVLETAAPLRPAALVSAIDPESMWSFIASMLSLFLSMNLLLGAFNLLPIPPLDGASLPMLVLSESASRSWMAIKSGLGFFGILIAWRLFDHVYPPVWRFAVNVLVGRGTML